MARGDVVLVDLGSPTAASGRVQAGRRPAVAVQADVPGGALPTVMVVPFTGKLNALRFPHTIRVEPSPTNGLAQPSVLLVFQLRVIDQTKILQAIGRLERHYLNQLDAEMQALLGLQHGQTP